MSALADKRPATIVTGAAQTALGIMIGVEEVEAMAMAPVPCRPTAAASSCCQVPSPTTGLAGTALLLRWRPPLPPRGQRPGAALQAGLPVKAAESMIWLMV